MSHFTKLDRANITDANAFAAAAKELGFTDIRKGAEIVDYYGKKEKADIAARAPDARYDVAIKKNKDGKYDMIADWWGIRGERRHYPALDKMGALHTDSKLQDALLRTTTKHAITANYRRQGFMPRVTEDEQHNITVTLTR